MWNIWWICNGVGGSTRRYSDKVSLFLPVVWHVNFQIGKFSDSRVQTLYQNSSEKVKNYSPPPQKKICRTVVRPFSFFPAQQQTSWKAGEPSEAQTFEGMSSSQEHQKPPKLFRNLAIAGRARLLSCSLWAFLFIFLRLLEPWWINDSLLFKFTPVNGFWLMVAGF